MLNRAVGLDTRVAYRAGTGRSGRAFRGLLTLICAGVLAGCAVGPDFERPAAPAVTSYTAGRVPVETASAPGHLGEAQRLVAGMPIHSQWWRGLGSSALDSLIEDALAHSPTLASARATLRQTQELFAAAVGIRTLPQLDMGLGGQRQRLDPITQGQHGPAREFGFYNASVEVHYRVDLAGGNRRALEAMAAKVDKHRFDLDAAHLTLAGNLVATAIDRARQDAQMLALEAILRAQEEQLRLMDERLRLGQVAPDEALALRVETEQTRAEHIELSRQRQQTGHLLAVLAGRLPGEGDMPVFTLEDFTLPVELPLVVPSELVRRRPDIQVAEALLHTASAEYGVAVSKLYPQLDLSASLGAQALSTGALFGAGSTVWNMVGQLVQPLFNPGLAAEKRAALAGIDVAAAYYQSVVLDALREVADVLVALDSDARRLSALVAADTAARESADSMHRRHVLGAASAIDLLVVQQQAQRAWMGRIAAQAQRLGDSVALYQAMGGGSE